MTNEERIQKIHKYFKYDYSGIVYNIHGEYTMNHAGADFDGDVVYSTSNENIINNVFYYDDEYRVTAYDVPKPTKKANLTQDDLYIADTFSFNQKIGSITNYASAICSLLPMFKKGSKERDLLEKRIQMSCIFQSKEIDRTKIGAKTKSTPKIFFTYRPIDEGDSDEVIEQKNFYNRILCDKKPYFFKYNYNDLKRNISSYNETKDADCYSKFGIRLKELLDKEKMAADSGKNKEELISEKEIEFLKTYHYWYPAIDSDCNMNRLCRFIEDQDFCIKEQTKGSEFDYRVLMSDKRKEGLREDNTDIGIYITIRSEIERTFKDWDIKFKTGEKSKDKKSIEGYVFVGDGKSNSNLKKNNDNEKIKQQKEAEYKALKERLLCIVDDEEDITDYLINIFYVEHKSYNKSTLWTLCGEQIFKNIYCRCVDEGGIIKYPIVVDDRCINIEDGQSESIFRYLYDQYCIGKIDINGIFNLKSNNCSNKEDNNDTIEEDENDVIEEDENDVIEEDENDVIEEESGVEAENKPGECSNG